MFGMSSSEDTDKKLSGKKIAILATDGFEQSELFEPKKALENAGAKVEIISLKSGNIKAWSKGNWGETIPVDITVDHAQVANFSGLVLPGGVMNPDKLRSNHHAVEFVREFVDSGKPIAAICHGPQILIETNALMDREVTSYPSLKSDMINAGAHWVDEEVVTDNGLVTSRSPEDIPAFNKKMIEEFCEGAHAPNPKRAIPLGGPVVHH